MDNKAEETLNNMRKGIEEVMGKMSSISDMVQKAMPVSEIKETEINGVSCKIYMDANGLARIEFKNKEDGKRFFNDPNKEVEKLQDEIKKLNVDYIFVRQERENAENRYKQCDEKLKFSYKSFEELKTEFAEIKKTNWYKLFQFLKKK
ncbi:hypothetical protein UFOVP916_39 [uncultured Caudovirales phage]|uniref:Uncharacterized protein n=1 Tax=uncultured Caudovirales phage TaxID=2100421 RepID=A0A6J5RPK8_9CAUD|nr:hypothetical protein UFOVP827_60 [uncultured Caudovirales phage]CAB4171468.1 hypothetical protein UFOVP916_39 [uncultured Caudovirales phage]CAB4177471.1 hypothetical protein UFOVP1001_63 [uncultured Caudovirales phage]CAB4199029.1 hypothetical protein UFOVP1338_13 [uncultured Caudovirales phage]CAB4213335.1 hypothetical protein UFOVP1447_8 [uncultured Caudovirales phage]